ncbi:EAL domain-containing protein [Sporosarcina sp. Marseille-Q4063]|nr:EAL domain-containing protein [Sporosarcina sp. Marseille-Q4063]
MTTYLDTSGAITYTNNLFLETSKWTPKRVLGKTIWQMFPETTEGQDQAHLIWEQLSSKSAWSGTVEKVNRLGEQYFVNMTAIPIHYQDEGLVSIVLFEMDITEDVQLRDRLEKIAYVDHETGLMSRHSLESTVNRLIANNDHFTFVYITIDHFYTLKDLHSDDEAKEIIKSFTNRMKRFFKDDSIARIGTNEFVVLTQFGSWYVEGFLDFLKMHPIYINNTALELSVSGGIVRFPEDQPTYPHLMKTALTATRETIDEGGGRIRTLSAESHKKLNRKALIDRKLQTAIIENELQVVYQPQVEVTTGKVILYEALVRWNNSELGTVSPDELIPIAEENGFIHKIGAFVLKEAAGLAAKWHAEGHDLTISVNSSVREFSNPDFKKEIMQILTKASCPPSLIQLEITEKFAFKAEEESSIFRQMNELQSEGIEFALDDFGTGYASFRYMQDLPISKIKIDKFFVQSITTNEQTKKLVEGMIQFGKSMGLYVIAEGVETKMQYSILKDLGVDAVQGYYLGLPTSVQNINLHN